MPDWIKQAYEIVVAARRKRTDTLTREQAETLLVDHAEFSDAPADAEYALEHLLNTGWLYQVNDDLRITNRCSGEE